MFDKLVRSFVGIEDLTVDPSFCVSSFPLEDLWEVHPHLRVSLGRDILPRYQGIPTLNVHTAHPRDLMLIKLHHLGTAKFRPCPDLPADPTILEYTLQHGSTSFQDEELQEHAFFSYANVQNETPWFERKSLNIIQDWYTDKQFGKIYTGGYYYRKYWMVMDQTHRPPFTYREDELYKHAFQTFGDFITGALLSLPLPLEERKRCWEKYNCDLFRLNMRTSRVFLDHCWILQRSQHPVLSCFNEGNPCTEYYIRYQYQKLYIDYQQPDFTEREAAYHLYFTLKYLFNLDLEHPFRPYRLLGVHLERESMPGVSYETISYQHIGQLIATNLPQYLYITFTFL